MQNLTCPALDDAGLAMGARPGQGSSGAHLELHCARSGRLSRSLARAGAWWRPASVLGLLPLAGCASASAPSHVFFGAYFPSWLLFSLLWGALAVAVRLVMVLTHSGASWPWPLALCLAAGFLLALGGWRLAMGALP